MVVLDLLSLIAQAIPQYLQRLDLLLIVGVVLLMVYTQYARAASVERRLWGFVKRRPAATLLKACALGCLGGVLATLLFVVVGISLSAVGIWYLWLLAIALMFIRPRFLCFSYGAGLLALFHLLTGRPELDIPALMALVAVLHLVEAALIYLSGSEGATPVFVRIPGGRVVGGFALQRFWPLPFIALIGALVPAEMIQATPGIDMPAWWPIIRPSGPEAIGMEVAFTLFPVVAALGYSDISITTLPEQKAKRTALSLVGYSVGLLVLAVLAQWGTPFAVAAALFSPLAHEWVIMRARNAEVKGAPSFSGSEPMVLDVHPDSPAARMGIRTGDVITAVNGTTIRTRRELAEAMEPWSLNPVIEVTNSFTHERRRLSYKGKIPPLGVILIPEPWMPAHASLSDGRPVAQVLRRWVGKFTPTR